jgi:TPR repeat protein
MGKLNTTFRIRPFYNCCLRSKPGSLADFGGAVRRTLTLILGSLLISLNASAQALRQNWAPTLAWSASSFECPAAAEKKTIETAAINGDPDAQTKFGKAQLHSCSGWKNPVEALQFLNLAANQNKIEAQIALGEIFRDGDGVPRDPLQASRWFARAADQGNLRAINDLGVSYASLSAFPGKEGKALQLFSQAAQSGFPAAQYNLATRYDLGAGVAQNYATAREWYAKAAEQKQPDAAYRLGMLCERGQGGVKDPSAAADWFHRAAEFGSDDAKIKLGLISPSQARSANSGYFQYMAGLSLLSGRSAPRDEAKAIEFFQQSADAGFPPAMVELGTMYQFGQGTAKDERKAQAYFMQSIARDPKYPVGYNNLAWLYVTTKNPKLHNAKKALELASKAVELSNKKDGASLDTLAHAYFELGNLDVALENEQLAARLAPKDDFIQKTLEEYKAAKEKQKSAN